MNRIYLCIDLKSFYASVECVERGLNPITTNLVVADESRTKKTICLAVTPSLKQYGLSGRSRLFEVDKRVKEVNRQRRYKINCNFLGKSYDDIELRNNPKLELDYIVATPRMKYYIKYSTKIYNVYLNYLAPEDIYVYSIDEVFCDITNYLGLYELSPIQLVTKIIKDVYEKTGITATAGIGTNMYLAKIAMDVVAKNVDANENGVRVAFLDEMMYRKRLWSHRPLTDFWRIGKGIAKKLEDNGMYTMGDVALSSIENENKLFSIFGVNAELLIDYAWGWEPCTIKDVKQYKPATNSLSSAQVLHEPYDYKKTKLIVREMVELLVLDMVKRRCVTDQVVLTINYDISNLTNYEIARFYDGEVEKDYYGRRVPKPAHGTVRLDHKTASVSLISKELMVLFDKIINPVLLSRKVCIALCNIIDENSVKDYRIIKQFDLFSDTVEESNKKEQELNDEKMEKKIQQTIIDIRNKYGKNAILKVMNLEEGGTTIERNEQVGGHKE